MEDFFENNNYLNENGLISFWNKKIKPLIYKKSTLQKDLVVKNPRVTVDLPDGYTFPKGTTMDEMFRYLYRHVYDEVNPTTPVIEPTVTLKIEMQSEAELNSVVEYTVSKKQFNQGTVGTCVEPWEVEANQGTMPSGCTEIPDTLEIHWGTTNNPSNWNDDDKVDEETYTDQITVSQAGKNYIGKYFAGRVGYTASPEHQAKTSYGNAVDPDIAGITYISEGLSELTEPVTGSVIGYYPTFGNVSSTEISTSSNVVVNLGNKYNTVGEHIFYYGPVNTVGGQNITFELFIPADLNATITYYDTITRNYVEVPFEVVSGYKATLPAGDDTSKFPSLSGDPEGVDYKLLRYLPGFAFGARKYKLVLTENNNN